ncbi:MAG TPA: family 78 glycoside hydrolase catalytic domain [Tepidisphaeraceae bacterium]
MTDLRCESTTAPTGIDAERPLLSWTLTADAAARGVRQTAYQIRVASSAERLAQDQADMWDSGRVATDHLAPMAYAGKPLVSGQRCFWTVRVWDNVSPGPIDAVASHWTMGLRQPEDWAPATWISAGTEAAKSADSILLRRGFSTKAGLARAVVFVSGLGQYELSINGQKVGDDLLSPGWTDYKKTVLYDTFDVTDKVRAGSDNAVGLILADGMYNIKPTRGRYVKFTNSFGPPKAIALLRLEYQDGSTQTVGTDRSWTLLPSPITYSNVFGGEDYDPRRLPPHWDEPQFSTGDAATPAVETDGPGGVLRGHSAAAPPIRAIGTHKPVTAKDLSPSVTVYDLGQNASHMPRLTVHGPAGSYVRVIPSELLGRDGYVDRASCVQDAGGPAWWQYTLAGTGREMYFPKFFYQGCRYLQVERFPAAAGGELPTIDSIEGAVVHSAAEPVGAFATSNTLFNKTYDLVRWAQRSNMMSVMTDCPHREKLGWLEELHLNGPSLRYNFKLDRLYVKEMNDMADAQLPGGLVPNIAPEYFLAHTAKLDDPFRNSVEWGSAFILSAWQQYHFTGDSTLLHDHYPRMLRYHAFISGMAKDSIISTGLGDWYDLGPKPPWGSQLTPPAFTGTAIYYYDTCVLADVARMLGLSDDALRLTAQAEKIKTAFNAKFLDAANGRYSTGSQCTSAMPLALGLTPPEHRAAVLNTLISDIRSRGNALSAGDVGYRFVLRALADAGRSDVIFDMNNQSDRPGYGMQIARGATALTEKWDASVGNFGSQNHFMLGQINEWFFHDLAGIQFDLATPGFERIVIKPAPVGDLTWVKASYESVRGRIVSEWTNGPAGLTMYVTIPAGTTATVFVPTPDANKVREGDGPASEASGVTFLRSENGAAVYAVGSGSFAFKSGRP